jgi:hypothetical protein
MKSILLKTINPGFSPGRPEFSPRSVHGGCVVHRVAWGRVFSAYFDFSCEFSFHQILRFSHLSPRVGTVGHFRPKYQGAKSYRTRRVRRNSHKLAFCADHKHLIKFYKQAESKRIKLKKCRCDFCVVRYGERAPFPISLLM